MAQGIDGLSGAFAARPRTHARHITVIVCKNRAKPLTGVGFLAGHRVTHFHYLKIAALQPFKRPDLVVVPTAVRSSADKPIAAVVCQDHSIFLQGL